ncbi:MAG: hypothetical protein J4N79_05120, partial [Chloroflexi bacterium]|nr:hypothetical protein [Chloroflexota bacterium]
MRPNQQDDEATTRYRRRTGGSRNTLRIVLALVVGIGVVITTLVLANTYDFNSAVEPPQDESGPTGKNVGDNTGAGASSSRDADALTSGSGGSNEPT